MAMKVNSGSTVSDINVTPMVDIMLVLLIIFMVITPMLQKTVSVNLAESQNPRDMPDEDKEDAAVVAVTRDGKIFLRSTPLNLDDLTTKIKDMIADRLDKTVYLKSDARAKYGIVVQAVDSIRAAGVEQLGLITEKVEQRGAPPPPPTALPGQ